MRTASQSGTCRCCWQRGLGAILAEQRRSARIVNTSYGGTVQDAINRARPMVQQAPDDSPGLH